MLSVDEIFDRRYRIIKTVGKGGMGLVYLAMDITDGTRWAIKESQITEQNESLLHDEVDIMERIAHPAFPAFRSSLEQNGFLYIVMEYIDGTTLNDIITREGAVEEKRVVQWFVDTAEALRYLHGMNPPVVYRDFKPSNIMIDSSGNVRIIDLGIAQEYREGGAEVREAVLTRGYAAPEQYNKRYRLDERTDIYGLAVTMHYLLTGKNPNQPPYEFRPARKLRPEVSRAIDYILRKCLQPNPGKRYGNVSLLLEDLRRIGELDHEIIARERKRRALAAAAAALVLIAAGGAYALNTMSGERAIESYYSNIDRAKAAGSIGEAQSYLEDAMKDAPDNPDAYIAWAQTYIRFGQTDEAVDYINDVIIAKFPDIYNNEDFLTLTDEIQD